MQNILACICIIIGTIIGAGFASGQEIVSFFNRFNQYGIYGIIIACFLFGIVSIIMIFLINQNNISSYQKLVCNKKVIIIMMEIFSFICFCIMVSGISAFLNEAFNIPFFISSLTAGSLCYILLLKKFSGMEKVSIILVPLIIIGIVLICTKQYDVSLFAVDGINYNKNIFTDNWLISSVIYASYNTLILLPVLTNFKRYDLKYTEVLLVGFISAIFLCVMAILIYNVCNIFYPQILSVELPTLKLAMMHGTIVRTFYCIVILSAILTTAFSTGYSFLCMKDEKNYNRNVALICIAAVLLSKVGFSNLINTFFPLFGYLGILQIIMVIVMQLKIYKNRKD